MGLWQYHGRAHQYRREVLRRPGQIGYPACPGSPQGVWPATWQGFFLQTGEPGSGFFHGDPEGINQFAAHGAHLALFTTGCGSTTGGLIPVIKVIGNPNRMQLIRDNADFDVTPVVLGERTVQEMGEALYAEVLAVAAGKLTRSEILGHFEV